MLRSTKSFAQHTPGTIDLEISDPVLMLNEVAKRYESTERVLMEYVDNALDDAEALYRENDGAYPYPIHIKVVIDLEARSITIQDNCRGMTREVLERVVRNIGESQKRGQSWLNGRFGFGVHAFRAAAAGITFQTKHARSSHHGLSLQRNQHRGIKEAKRIDAPFSSDSGTGCLVTITDLQPDWLHAVTVASIKDEIERHFERLIARPHLRITVEAVGEKPVVCLPFDYAQVAGTAVSTIQHITYKEQTFPITIHLNVAANVARRPASFFARGRRIGAIREIKSFMRKSKLKTSVWSHPNLMGYIEVGDLVQPLINRDDFVRTRSRTLLYDTIVSFEDQIQQHLSRINQTQQQNKLTQLEEVVQNAWKMMGSETAVSNPQAPAPQITASPTLTTQQEPAKLNAFEIRFAEPQPVTTTAQPRTWQHNNTIYVNIAHPDFQERIRFTRQGQPRITERFNAYLAAVLSIYHVQYEDADPRVLLQSQLDFIFQMETTLQKQRGKLAATFADSSVC